MKKKWIIGMTVAALLVGGTIAVSAATNSNKASGTDPGKMEMLAIEAAKEIALANYDGVIDSIKLEKKRDWTYYDVDIKTETKEIDLDIDAYTGNILSVKEELRDDLYDDDRDDDSNGNKNKLQNKQNSEGSKDDADDKDDDLESVTIGNNKNSQSKDNKNKQSSKNDKTLSLSREEAIKIAEQKTGAKVIEIEKERENGRLVYEIELLSKTHEIEIKMDIHTGEIIEIEYEFQDDDWDDDDDDDNRDDD